MAVAEENIRLVSKDLADELVEEGTPYVVGEVGRVLISNTWLPDERNAVIELDLTSWLGVKAITAKGLKRQNILGHFAPLLQPMDDD